MRAYLVTSAVCAALVLVLLPDSSVGARQKRTAAQPSDAASPARRYASLDARQCRRELARRKIRFRELESARGVRDPVRIRGKIGSVRYRTNYTSAEKRRTTPYEVYDCRLVLALYDLSKILWTHDIVEARIYSAWRPPSKRWPKNKHGVRHPGGLAADLQRFIKKNGESLNIEEDFNGKIGATLCGPEAVPPDPPTVQARELRSIVCEAVDQRIFQSILTPNYNRPHFNHLHVEVRPEVSWFIYR